MQKLIENYHYYMENELMVFSSYYHKERGECCKSRCRHCPFESYGKPNPEIVEDTALELKSKSKNTDGKSL